MVGDCVRVAILVDAESSDAHCPVVGARFPMGGAEAAQPGAGKRGGGVAGGVSQRGQRAAVVGDAGDWLVDNQMVVLMV